MKIIKPEYACESCLKWPEECICDDSCATCGHKREDHAVFYRPTEDGEQAEWYECSAYGQPCGCKEFAEPQGQE